MTSKKSTAAKRAMQVPFKEFMGKYASQIETGHAEDRRRSANVGIADLLKGGFEPFPWVCSPEELWEAVEAWWPVRLLREAAKENDAEGCKRMLHYWLLNLHVIPPEGVLAPWRGKPGRPSKIETNMIHATWIDLGEPSLFKNELAKRFYGTQFNRADGRERRRLRNLCRTAVVRVQRKPAPKSLPN